MTFATILGQSKVFNDLILDYLMRTEWGLLTEDQRRVMMTLAIFNHHVPTHAITYITTYFYPGLQVEPCLNALIRRNLVKTLGNRETYQLSPLDQQYAYSRMSVLEVGSVSQLPTIILPDEPAADDDVALPPLPATSPTFSLLAAHERAATFYEMLQKK